MDEHCYLVDLGTAATIWLNAAAKAFWGAHAAAGLIASPACMTHLRQHRDARADVTLCGDGRVRTLSCRFKPIRLAAGREAVLLRVLPAAESIGAPDPSAVSAERLRDFAAAASDWFWETDAGGRFTYVSPGITLASGDRPEDIVGRTHEEIAKASGRPEAMSEIEPILSAVARRQPFADVVLGRLRSDGKLLHVSTSGRPRFDAAANFLGYRGCGRNLTAQVEAERRLAESEQRFRDFAEVSADWFWELDHEFRFTFLAGSATFRDSAGMAELIGQQPLKERLLGISEADWEAHKAALEARQPFANFRFDEIDEAGRQRHYSVSGKPVFDASGGFAGYRGTGRDITELAEVEHSLRQMIDGVPAVINIADAEGRYVRANSYFAQLCGEPAEAIVGRSIGAYSGRAAVERALELNRQVIETGAPIGPYETKYRTRAGGELDYLVRKVAMRDGVGRVTGVLTVGMDMSALKQAQLELEAAKAQLEASEARFRDFAETASDWFYELDSGLRFSFISPQAGARTGEDADALIGKKPSRDGLFGVGEAAWQAHMAALEARRVVSDFRFAKLGVDGGLRHFSVSAKPIFDRDGVFRGYRGTGRDMTALVEAERSLRQVVDSMPAVIAVRDADMRYLLVNDCYARQFGATAESVVGKPTGTYLGQQKAAEVVARDRQVFETGVSIGPYETVMPNAEGEARHWLVEKVPLRSAENKVRAVLTVGTDITALKQAQAELLVAQQRLAASERRFRDFAEIGSDVTWEMGPDLRFTHISDSVEQITGLPAAGYLGKRNIDLGPDDSRREALERMLEDRRTIRELPFSRPLGDGRVVHLMYSAKPIFGHDGGFLGYRGTIRDITAQREAEIETDRLRKVRDLATAADMAKTRFLANMSHELRTPLNAILGFAEVLAGEMLGPLGAAPYAGYARDIESSGKRLLAIISDLLDMSRIQLDEFRLELEPVGLAGLVGDCVTTARSAAPADSAPIVAAPIHPDWVLDVDRRALRQVLGRLLSNALKFTPATGRITVELRHERGGAVTLCVTDTGCGIAAERMPTLFEPFQRSGAQLTRGGKGSGLGLWVSRALIELHGGTLTLASTLGQGTVASVTLPGERVRQRPPLLRIAS